MQRPTNLNLNNTLQDLKNLNHPDSPINIEKSMYARPVGFLTVIIVAIVFFLIYFYCLRATSPIVERTQIVTTSSQQKPISKEAPRQTEQITTTTITIPSL